MTLGYVLRRILVSVPTVLLVVLMVFVAIHLVPGTVVDMMLGTQNYLTEEQIRQLYTQYGLDKPLIVQYFAWLKNTVSFNFGVSLRTGKPVLQLILNRLPVTLELAALSMVIALTLGIVLGVASAVKRNSFADDIIKVFSLIGISSPAFWIGSIFIVLFSGLFREFNIFGYVPINHDPLKNLQSMFLPSLTLGLMICAQIVRVTRASMLDVLRQEYIKTAMAKGVSRTALIFKHALKNALIPIVTVSGIQLGYLIGGTIVIENLFALPGLGRLLLQAVNERDYPVVQSIVLFVAIMIVALNILIDFVYTLLDPRVELK
ncbi:glutathione ABC transporter permease [Thermotoga sp. Ku-13t]|uniref:ABC transporter permease n=1 Tax=Thermotoga sp. Ku-13t TaxID=1755813 RepID=UPI0013EBE501|nr:ABC transporter permease [Thermotoga sp. Ku-13t]KAF2957853.1 glutathione ABC transporter permease [Thermotoga sp. Ku-13t]